MEKNLQKKVDWALKIIHTAGRMAYLHKEPLEICYSGGKDSDVILELARMSGVEFRAIYKNTTIDPPGTIMHAIENGVEIHQPKENFKQIVERKGLPSRLRRHCCDILKEYKILKYAVIGVRQDESIKRAQYQEPSVCRKYKSNGEAELFMPILYFTAKDIERFILERDIKCHPLYYDNNGVFRVNRRLGCIGCPLAYKKHRIKEFKQFPGFAKLYINAAQKFLNNHPESHTLVNFKDAVEWFTFTLYCDTMDEWDYKFGPTLFDDGVNCHDYLENLLGIKI